MTNEASRFNALACGRRWGKSKFLTYRMAHTALRGERYGYFAATYKLLNEVFDEASHRLRPIASVSKSEKKISLVTGGVIEFWTLEDEDAGRSRRYHEVGIDEAGLVKNLESRWNEAIRPTLTDFRGGAWLAGTPKGKNFFSVAFYNGQDPENRDWSSWQMPTVTNPYIDPDEIEDARRQMPDRAFRQEYLAEFIDEAGGVFRGVREVVAKNVKSRDPQGAVYIGVDLARTEDFTVLTAIDVNGNQLAFERFNQISWERQIGAIKHFFGKFPNATGWIDSTGVGDPIYERLRDAGLNVKSYKFSNESKRQLIDNLSMQIEQEKMSLLDIQEQTNELLAYQYELTPSRNIRMNAPEGMHDDCVIALALAANGLSQGGFWYG